ncbi:MAG: PAS domain-containing protein [Nitrospirae bacterium]|nr:PAS domain-containing protein [Nitrospirota bacterium]
MFSRKTNKITMVRDLVLQRLPLVLLVMGVTSIGLITAVDHIGRGMSQTFLYTDVVHEMEIELSKAHLALEEDLRGIQGQEIALVWQGIDRAEEMALAALNGGKTLHGHKVKPLSDNSIRADMEDLRALIVRFRGLARDVYDNRSQLTKITSMDSVYHQFLEKAFVLDEQLEELQSEAEQRSKRLILLILVSWTCIISAAVIGLWYREVLSRRMQAAIQNAKHQWEHTFDVIPDLIAVIDKDHRIIRANKAMAEKMGLEPKELLGKKCYELFHKISGPIESCPHARLLHDNQEHTAEIYEKEFGAYFLVSVSPLLDSKGSFIGSVHVARDITAQKRDAADLMTYRNRLEELVDQRTNELAETNENLRMEILSHKETAEALQLSEGRFRQLSQQFNVLLDAIPDSLVLMSPELKVMWANKSARQTLMPAEAQHSEYCYTLWHKQDRPCDNCPVLKSFQSGNPEAIQLSTPDSRIWAVRSYPIKNDQGEVESVMELSTDITEKKSIQAEQMRANHLASIGELAAGVAHEINNPINGIINYAQIIVNSAGPADREYEIAKRIIKEGERISFIVTSLLSFARERKEEKIPVQVQQVLSDTLALTETQLKKSGIDLRLEIDPHIPLIKGHAQQIQQVFLNIINNARYALIQKYPNSDPDKIFRITAGEAIIDGEPFVQIVFEDHGIGIPAHIVDKVMSPFYTTKPVGIGTGLGLSISHGIVVDHDGRLSVESEEGAYTRIIVALPAYKKIKQVDSL